jgi:tetratricopeptide (TPR) repeat protein
MKSVDWVRSGALAAVLMVACGFSAPAAQAEMSREFQTDIAPATQAFNSKDYKAALSQAKKALSVAKNKEEKTLAYKIILGAATQTQSWGDVESAGEAMLAMEPPAAEKTHVLEQLQYAYLAQRRYDKALPVTKQVIAATGGNQRDYEILWSEYEFAKDCPNGLQALDKATKGRPLKEAEAKWQYLCYYNAKDMAKALPLLEQFNLRFRDPKMFVALLTQYMKANPPMDDLAALNLQRLGAQHDFLTEADQIIAYAQRALDAGSAGEAETILDKAVQKKWLVPDDKAKKLIAEVKRVAAEDKKGLEQADRESKAGKNGDKDFSVGVTHFGFGDYANAADALRRALLPDHVARVKRVDQANMTLGIALARLKKLDEAEKAFNAAKADPRQAKAAALWLAWLRS